MLCWFIYVVLEVFEFARDATLAEEWLISHEISAYNKDLGVC